METRNLSAAWNNSLTVLFPRKLLDQSATTTEAKYFGRA